MRKRGATNVFCGPHARRFPFVDRERHPDFEGTTNGTARRFAAAHGGPSRRREPMVPLRILGLLSSLWLSAVVSGQQVDTIRRTSHGVQATADGARAGGPDYTARFDARGVEFTPALGPTAAKPFPVRFTLDAVRRGASDVFARTADVAPVVAGEQVRYEHRGDLVEVYDVRAEGIEQSFVFASRPTGTGDLVVCGRITTELPFVAANDDGVRYELPEVGGVTFGSVTGVDANGATARGSIRVVEGGAGVEWVLPAAFVDHCAYPLVLDPLIGSAIAIGNLAGGDDVTPSIAFDDTNNRYLVVWNLQLAAGTDEVRGQFVTAGGTVLGGGFLIANGTVTRHAVANINGTNRFLVAYYIVSGSGPFTSSSIKVIAVDASTGALSNAVTVDSASSQLGSVSGPVVGGDSRAVNTAQTALVVYKNQPVGFSTGSVRSRIVHVPATGDPIATGAGPNSLAAGGGATITAQGGPSLRWLLTWWEVQSILSQPELKAGVIGSAGTMCGTPITLFLPAMGDTFGSAVSASPDGTTFLVAWHTSNAGAEDVQSTRVVWSGTCASGTLTSGPVLTLPTAVGLQDEPAVAFAKDKFLLAWRNRTSFSATPRILVKGLDPATCATCGAEWSVDSTILGLETPAIASRYSAGDTASDEALVVWSNTAIRGRRFEARGSATVTGLGGGCSLNGFDDFASYDGDAVLGNTNFQLVLANPVSLPLALILGFSAMSAPCGSCTIVPALDVLVPAANPYPVPIPCDPALVGVDLYAQWLLLKPSDCPILPDFAFSNTLRFTIGE